MKGFYLFKSIRNREIGALNGIDENKNMNYVRTCSNHSLSVALVAPFARPVAVHTNYVTKNRLNILRFKQERMTKMM